MINQNAVPSETDASHDSGQGDMTLPLANTTRVMRDALSGQSGDVRIAKEAQQYMTNLATEFILFVSSESLRRELTRRAADISSTMLKPKHTLAGQDILEALERLGFNDYLPSLKRHLERYQAVSCPPSDPQENNVIATEFRKRTSSELGLPADPEEHFTHRPPPASDI